MWDFDLGANLRFVFLTWPYVALRIVICLVALVLTLVFMGFGAVLGYGLMAGAGDVDARIIGGCLGALAAFVIGCGLFYIARAYILYLVTAGQIAVLVDLMDGHSVPLGLGQLRHGAREVKARFAQSSALFVLHELIHGVTRLFSSLLSFLPVPGLSSIVNAFLRVSVGLIDEIILAYAIRTRSEDPVEAARHAVILYAQNSAAMMRNAAWLALFIHMMTAAIFAMGLGLAVLLAPALEGLSWIVAAILVFIGTLVLRATFVRSLAVACLWQAFMRVTDGQQPDPAWESRLNMGGIGGNSGAMFPNVHTIG